MNKLFSILTREDAAKITSLETNIRRYRFKQVQILKNCLVERRGSYYDWAIAYFLEDLSTLFEGSEETLAQIPDCAKQAYNIMFNAFDDTMANLIGAH